MYEVSPEPPLLDAILSLLAFCGAIMLFFTLHWVGSLVAFCLGVVLAVRFIRWTLLWWRVVGHRGDDDA